MSLLEEIQRVRQNVADGREGGQMQVLVIMTWLELVVQRLEALELDENVKETVGVGHRIVKLEAAMTRLESQGSKTVASAQLGEQYEELKNIGVRLTALEESVSRLEEVAINRGWKLSRGPV